MSKVYILILRLLIDKFKRKIEALEMALDAYLANSGSIVAGGTNFIANSPPGFFEFSKMLKRLK